MTPEERKRFIEEHPESLNAAMQRLDVAIDDLMEQFQASRVYALMVRFLLWMARQFDRGEAV